MMIEDGCEEINKISTQAHDINPIGNGSETATGRQQHHGKLVERTPKGKPMHGT